jgi:hypothetical protein
MAVSKKRKNTTTTGTRARGKPAEPGPPTAGDSSHDPSSGRGAGPSQLEKGTYEILRDRLKRHSAHLRQRLEQLNEARRAVFGAIPTRLVATQHITTANNCVPRDMVPVSNQFLFGYNVHIGLKAETQLQDVFAIYGFGDDAFHEASLDLIRDEQFQHDFRQLYRYYKQTTFSKFAMVGPSLFMVFQVGKTPADIKTFKWLVEEGRLRYLGNRFDHEYRFPPQHEFEWTRTHRDLHRAGPHPHISIEDRVFVETVGGDLTIKVEDNTEIGEGIYSEPVEDKDQVLDDAEIFFASLGNIILLKIRPYQEKQFRYIAYNEKLHRALRLDTIESACVLLPEGHGLIFSNGYYLQNGEHKTFETSLHDLQFEKRIASPNGEDHLYVFYNGEAGIYVLLSYNMIEQRVETPMICGGYSFFTNGRLALFRTQLEPQKHHAIQIWQTAYVGADHMPPAQTDSMLFKIGNRDIVRGMAECHEIAALADRDDSYADLYIDLVKKTTDVIDAYFWLDQDETFHLREPLDQIRDAAAAAVSEFDKVVRIRRNTRDELARVEGAAKKLFASIAAQRLEQIDDFVQSLSSLRDLRGQIASLRDLRYVDLALTDQLAKQAADQVDVLAKRCVQFLLRPEALEPYQQRVNRERDRTGALATAADARQLDGEMAETAQQLQMLIEVVSNLKIDDATIRTRIIDDISATFSYLNQARAGLKTKMQQLLETEGAAEFHAQTKLLGQTVSNYLDVCDSPAKCDEYLTKLMVQIEELEGRFAEFDQYLVHLSEKREEIYSALDARKLALIERRNQRAAALGQAADRILKGIDTRVRGMESIDQIHSYLVSDLMVEKVRDILRQLTELEDSVRVDDIQSRLKTIREDAVRQLKDRQQLFEDGQNVIRLGRRRFLVNVQPLDLTTIQKDGQMFFHLTGTNFLEPIADQQFQQTRDLWRQELVSENHQVYRAEYLAYEMFQRLSQDGLPSADAVAGMEPNPLVALVQKYMGPRYAEGYVKGVHDHDAACILRGLAELAKNLGHKRFPSPARALAALFWYQLPNDEQKAFLAAQLGGVAEITRVFGPANQYTDYVNQLEAGLVEFLRGSRVFPETLARLAAEFLFEELAGARSFSVSIEAAEICRAFQQHSMRRDSLQTFSQSVDRLRKRPVDAFVLLRKWVQAFLSHQQPPHDPMYADEAAVVLLDGSLEERRLLEAPIACELTGMLGDHPLITAGRYRLHYHEFVARLDHFQRESVPRFQQYTSLKKELVDRKREMLRLDELRPRVLTSFVRNRLIDEVYLPLVGDNLAKQVGEAGEQKRTDRSGLLLLVSPPGYGKTTLMEYLANRLGITFVKINGPAIGHRVTSLDPAEAPNAAARQEVERLNLSLEMGDNIMIYVDDIQHCNTEFLQKFISLCDAQRKIEGVYQGRTRTYDLRGKKVAVVMAGNPYTESGEKFRIPDMLANRADTYNLGDIIADKRDVFELSYLENALTSNPTLRILATRSQSDVYAVIQLAEGRPSESVQLEGNYSVDELNELVATMRKLMRVRDVVLTVNRQYIRSAAQAEAYRREPPFKLQGSYRDMNKIAEQVSPVMNETELETLIWSHYENQAQTLTTDAEANLLKLKELLEKMDQRDRERWEEIKRKFERNTLLKGVGSDDKFGQAISQLLALNDGLTSLRETLGQAVTRLSDADSRQHQYASEVATRLSVLAEGLSTLRQSLDEGVELLARSPPPPASATQKPDGAPVPKIQILNRVPREFMHVIQAQFRLMQSWVKPLERLSERSAQESESLRSAVDQAFAQYQQLIQRLEAASPGPGDNT